MRATTLGHFVQRTIENTETDGRKPSAALAYKFRKLIHTDYRKMVRRFFDRSEMQELISAGKRIAWPRLNKVAAPPTPVSQLKKYSAALGIELVVGRAKLSKEVYGFYLPKTSRVPKPLIWLDASVTHEATLGATFLHETGHHIAREVFGHRARLNSLDRASARHRLENRNEIAADVFVSLAAMPRRTAMAMFGPSRGTEDLRRAFDRICKRYRISPDARADDEDAMILLVGILHYVKLREALLAEFGG